MAFDYTNLYPDTSGNGGYTKSWNYTTVGDSIAVCSASGYFNKVSSRLGIGDNISIAVVDAFDKTRTTLVEFATLLVSANAGGVVTTTNPSRSIAAADVLSFIDINIYSYNASGSNQVTTGTITSGSNALVLTSALDFKNNHGIAIFGAGPVATVQQPTGLAGTVNGTAGSTAHTYQLASVDAFAGIGIAIGTVSVTTANATIDENNYVGLSWTAPAAGPVPKAYAVYKDGAFIGLSAATSFNDNNIVRSRPAWCPATPPAAATSAMLVSSIVSGAGTAAITLAAPASTTVSLASVSHDDTAAVTAALNAALGTKRLVVPDGTYMMSASASIVPTASCEVICARGAIFKSQTNLGDRLIDFNDNTGTGRYGLKWQGGTFDNSGGIFGIAVSSNSCFTLTRLSNVQFNGVLFQGASTRALASKTTDSGISTVTVSNLIVTNCIFLGQGDNGIYLSGGASYGGSDDGGENIISNNVFVNCGIGVAVKRQLPRCVITNNSMTNGFAGVALFEASSPPIDPGRQSLIANNIIRRMTSTGICIHEGAADTDDGSGTGLSRASRTQIIGNKILDFGYLDDGTTAYVGSTAFGSVIAGITIQGASQCRIHGNMIGLEDWTNGGNGTALHKGVYINSFVLNAVTYNPDRTVVTDNDFVNVSRGIVEGAATMGATMASDNCYTNVTTPHTFLNASSFGGTLDAANAAIRYFFGTTPTEAYRISAAGSIATRFRTFLDTVGFTKIAKATATLNFGAVGANNTSDLTVTITGAVVNGGQAIVNPQASNLSPTGISYAAWVSAADTITVRAINHTAGSITIPSGSFVVNGLNIT